MKFCFVGVEFSAFVDEKDLTLRKILFLPSQGRLITLATPGNILHFWEIDDNKVEKVSFFSFDLNIYPRQLLYGSISDQNNNSRFCQIRSHVTLY